METEGSLPCSQEPSAGPYPEANEFRSRLPPYFPEISVFFITKSNSKSPAGWSN
jgi:hypothetical protein